jgi:hypothetical protein
MKHVGVIESLIFMVLGVFSRVSAFSMKTNKVSLVGLFHHICLTNSIKVMQLVGLKSLEIPHFVRNDRKNIS